MGSFVLQLLGLYAGGILGSIVSATLGAVILLAVIGAIKKA
ncbi:GlsB/YeaQ/YmgE family stress response membrane protein [Oleiphilus sp. HI0067]|nr:GlsB/YeaQ/YmgE family stress response membrane protein [Oleiphilus sp. HI0067]